MVIFSQTPKIRWFNLLIKWITIGCVIPRTDHGLGGLNYKKVLTEREREREREREFNNHEFNVKVQFSFQAV